MDMSTSYWSYVPSGDAQLFTVVLLPAGDGKYPCIVTRTPYIDAHEKMTEDEICALSATQYATFTARGYAVVLQDCRGRGKSSGDCIPYINERADSRALYAWIRTQGFYNGEIFLKGASYSSSVHYCAAPFDPDIKGAVFGVQDTERYNICYRNGCMKKALHGGWYVGMYKAKSHLKKFYSPATFETLPLSLFTETVFGEPAEDFDEMLRSPRPTDPFWQTHAGGADARNATKDLPFPALFTTGFYDIYTGGVLAMWQAMSPKTRSRCALLISPYDHGDTYHEESGILFPLGRRTEKFGTDYELAWFDHIRKGEPARFEKGRITYYNLFENEWHTTEALTATDTLSIPLGDESVSYTYNPFDPPRFRGGLSAAFGGGCFQDKAEQRNDIITVYTLPFTEDICIRGNMSATLRVSSDCEDTCFYIRVSIEKEPGRDFGIRDDITTLCYQLGDYTPGEDVTLHFAFDGHAFCIKNGERLRVDIASASADHYVRHTNQKGLYSEQVTARIAHNTVHLKESCLVLPILREEGKK